ncbi:MAG: hypothetical protein HZC54_10680 [Verrucomicrobia bacterium]|nr:hypothetical protein [Verrucomicrobiota bacterium]
MTTDDIQRQHSRRLCNQQEIGNQFFFFLFLTIPGTALALSSAQSTGPITEEQ